MSNQNQFDQYKQKLLHAWGVFLAACGRFWEKVKTYSHTAVEFLRQKTAIVMRKLAELGQSVIQWLKKLWSRIRPWGRRLVQTLASWLLLLKEKTEMIAGKVKMWVASLAARLRKNEAELPAPEEPKALPVSQEAVAEAPAEHPADSEPASADPVETVCAEETSLEPAEMVPQEDQKPAAEVAEAGAAWKSNPWLTTIAAVLRAIGRGIMFVLKWLCKLYKLLMAAPVIWMAVKFAIENMNRLPEEVGLDIQSTGEFARMISRQEAVFWPLGITMFCLLLMFISKKPVLPWIISIFTLVLPWLIWLLNFYA